jgi:crotonobetainyl-CoA:carnitine CoA-transferase CaiB-like acyl-CoA transferase
MTEKNAPNPMGISVSDHLGGIFACYGVLAAIVARNRTGRGQRVETSLLEASIAFLAENAASHFESDGPPPGRATRTHAAQVYAFVAGDERPLVIHLSSPPKFWEGLARAAGRPDLLTDERFNPRNARVKNYDALYDILAGVFRTADRDHWIAKLRAEDVPCGPLNDLREVFEDPQVAYLGMRKELPHPKRGSVSVVGSAVRLSDTPVTIATAAPELGADTEEVLNASPPRR